MSPNDPALLRLCERLQLDATVDDAQLLRRFGQARDESAFAELVRRHGSLVFGVCRRMLGDNHAAEDAVQATFVLLARRASRLTHAGSLAGWLHAVALRISKQARRTEARRLRREQSAVPARNADDRTWRELRELLDAEIARLPEPYRLPLILCYLQSLPVAEAARRAGMAPAVFRGRLERGRQKLRRRLERLGLPLAAPLLLGVSAEALSASLARAATMAAQSTLAGASLAPGVAALLRGPALLGARSILVAAVFLLMAAVAAGVGGAGRSPAGPPPNPNRPPAGAGKPAANQHGDPLPPDAIARLGSSRFFYGNTLHDIVLSNDGKLVLAHGSNGNRLWEIATGKELPLPDVVKKQPVFPKDDHLVVVDVARAKLIDVRTGGELDSLPSKPESGPFAISADGKTLVYRARKTVPGKKESIGVLRFCNLQSGAEREAEDPVELSDNLEMEFSADGRVLVTFTRDVALRVWDVPDRKLRAKVPDPLKNSRRVAISPEGGTLAVVANGGEGVVLYEAHTFAKLPTLEGAPTDGVVSIAFSPDGLTIAVGSMYHGVGIWDRSTNRKLRSVAAEDYFVLSRMVFSRDGRILACSIANGVVLFDPATGEPRPNLGQTFALSLAFAPDGRTLISGQGISGNVIRMWDVPAGREIRHWNAGSQDVAKIVVPAKGDWFASLNLRGPVRIWDLSTGRERYSFDPGKTMTMAASPDGKWLVTTGRKPTFRVWDPATGMELRSFGGADRYFSEIAISPDGKFIAAIPSNEDPLQLWDVAAGKMLREIGPCGDKFSHLAYSPDGKAVARCNDDGIIRLFDPDTGHELRQFGRVMKSVEDHANIQMIAFSPDGRLIAGAYSDGSVRVWEAATGRVFTQFTGHRAGILAVAFSPDGKQLTSSSADRSILVWNLDRR
ncbi:MAG: sigma-70 family RNA polymerase sigma factor [Gemmataceae bacterium]